MKSRSVILMVAVLLALCIGFAFASGGKEAAAGNLVAVKILMPGGPQPPDANMVFEAAAKYAGPKIGAYPVIEFVPWDNWPNRKRLLLQAGEEMDIVFTASWSDFADEVSRNAWIPLDDLIDKNAPQLRKAVGVFLQGGTVNGKIYAVPTVKEQAEGTQFIYNKKFVDKYNVPITTIKSFAALEPWLQKIKDNEPGIVPYLLDGLSTPTETSRYHWDAVGNGRRFYLYKGKVLNSYNIDEMWDTIKYTRSWYQKGYYQAEADDAGTDYASQKYLSSGNWFAWSHVSHPGKAPEQSTAWGYPIVGGGPVWRQMVTKNILNGSMDAISRTSKKGVPAIKLLELMNIDKSFNNLLNFGIEGKHYTFVDNAKGIIKLNKAANAGEGYSPNMQWALQNQFLTYLTQGEDPTKWDQYKKYNADAGIYDTVGFIEDLKPVQTQLASVESVIQEYEPLLLRGLVDPAAVKAEFQKKLADAGIKDIEAELQKQVDAFLKSKGKK
jgi:putative aldouronate transport system substrate-binding protein